MFVSLPPGGLNPEDQKIYLYTHLRQQPIWYVLKERPSNMLTLTNKLKVVAHDFHHLFVYFFTR